MVHWGVPSSRALPGYPISAYNLYPFLLYFERELCGGKTPKKTKTE